MESALYYAASAIVWYASTPSASMVPFAVVALIVLRDADVIYRLRLRLRYWRHRRALRRSIGR